MNKNEKKPLLKGLSFGRRFTAVLTALILLLVLSLFLNVSIGSVKIAPAEVFSLLWDSIRLQVINLFTGGSRAGEIASLVSATTQSSILFKIRLPRMLLAMILGGGLSVSGYLLQVFFRNPIAGPFVLGISSGAKMIVGITLIFLSGVLPSLSSFDLIFAAFLGSLLVTLLVLLFSQKVPNMSMLLVIGIMVGYVCGAVTDFCITFANEHDVVNLTNWSMGSFSGASWDSVETSAIVCFLGTFAAMFLSKPISAYALGEDYARSMGVKIKPFRVLLILLSSILSACVTALAGPISFVGIAVPHIARTLLRTSRPSIMIPSSFLAGAVFCVFCDLIARTAFAPMELAIGTVTSFFGAPVVIYMMIQRRKIQEM